MIRLLRYCLFLVILSACKPLYQVSEVKPSHYELKTAKNDSITNLSVLPYKKQLDSEMKQVIAYSDSSLTRDGFESSLGNFVLMATEEYININKPELSGNCILFINRGGLRNNLPKGEIKVYNIFELMPFDNELVMLTVSGKKINEGLQTIVEKRHSFFGLSLIINNNNEILQAKIGNKIIEDNKIYKIITSDFIANGGDKFDFLLNPISYKLSNIKIRDAIIEYCKMLSEQNKQIIPYTDERFQISK